MINSKFRKKTVILFVLVFTLLIQSNVSATPLSEKKARLSAIKNELDDLDMRISTADEEYLQATNKLGNIKNKVYQTQIKLGNTRVKLNKDKNILNARVKGMYKNDNMSFLDLILDTKSFTEFLNSLDFINKIGNRDAQVIKKVKRTESELNKAEKELVAAKTQQQKTVNIVYQKKTNIENEMASRKKLLAGIEDDIKKLEEEQRKAELQRIAAQQMIIDKKAIINVSSGIPSNAPNTGVVGYARQEMGKPYRWGAAGPSSFDCSGLTMYVYAKVGISLPHSSAAQFGVGQAVSRENLQPGDLVFFGNPRIHHVGIYIGGGMMIDAPRTGDVVGVRSAFRSHYVGARRP